MSWIFGTISKKQEDKHKVEHIIQRSDLLLKAESRNSIILAGGNSSTCRIIRKSNLKVIVIGMPFLDKGLLPAIDSELLDIALNRQYKKLTGAYILVVCNGKMLEIYTDNMNLRKVYIYEDNQTICFSTNKFWIKKCLGLSIDLESLGIYWKTGICNGKSFVEDVSTVSGGNSISITNSVVIKKDSIKIRPDKCSLAQLENKLVRQLKSLDNISLGLSGGMDSRTILALLLKEKIDFTAHTFGEKTNYDVQIAKELGRKFGFKVKHYSPDILSDKSDIINRVEDFIEETEGTIPLVSMPLKEYFTELNKQGKIMIDGGFITNLRRYSYNKSILKLRSEILNNDAQALFNVFKTNKADIFTKDYNDLFYNKSIEQLQNILKENPFTDSKSIGDKLDLIKMKHLYQYFYSPGQAYYDNYLPNIMLGAHNEILSNMMSFSVDERKNSRLNYKIINSASKDLNKIPYVRYNSLMKTPRNIYVAYLKGRINSKLGKVYIRKDIHQLFNKLKPWIYDNLPLVYRQFPDLLARDEVEIAMLQYYKNGDLSQVNRINSIAQIVGVLKKY